MSFSRFAALTVLSLVLSAGVCLAQAPASAPASGPAGSVLQPTDRIVFIGDSITGLGERNEGGFARLIREALAKAHPGSSFEVVTLGASGSTVGAWLNFEARSRDPKEKEFFTDVPNNGVKANLAKHADVVIIMLGMNDILQPAVLDEKESLERWENSYLELIKKLRGRMTPRVVALGQCTMATEDPNSATNKFIDKLNEHVAAVAEKAGCLLLKTDDRYKEMLKNGRRLKNDFHLMYDYIHPNKEGQMAIALGMLTGLGDLTAVNVLQTSVIGPAMEDLRIHHIYGDRVIPLRPDGEAEVFAIQMWKDGDVVPGQKTDLHLFGGEGWKTLGHKSEGNGDIEFIVSGIPQKLTTFFTTTGKTEGPGISLSFATGDIRIHPPWLLSAGIIHVWREHQLDEKLARTPIDDAIEQGKDFTRPIELPLYSTSVAGYGLPKTTGTLKWQRFFPSVDYTGGDAPGNADFQSIVYPHTFESGYGARWVWSDTDRPVRLEVSSTGFTRQTYVQAWLNGKKEYSGQVSDEPKMRAEVRTRLKKGWNCLAFRCFHITYFFQRAVTLLPADKGDTLDDLRYSTVFKEPNSPAPAGTTIPKSKESAPK